MGFVGFLCNALIFTSLYKSFRFSTFSSFSVLCCSRSISNCGTLLCFICYSGPVALLGQSYGTEILGRKFGHVTTLTYKSVVYIQLAIAFNRFIATFFTFKYHLIFSRRGTFIILGSVWSMTALHCIPEFMGTTLRWLTIPIEGLSDGCGYTFFYESLSWDYLDTPCSALLGGPLLFYPSYSVFLSSITLNLIIFIKLSYHTLMYSKKMGIQAKQRHRKNVRFFVQSFLQELMYIFEALFLQLTRPHDRFFAFVSYSLLWESTHVWDGFIVVLYRSDIRSRLTCAQRKSIMRRMTKVPV
ncbi:hypothetical protein PRIPAC_77795 [Pristionchus pacificus]|uniref:G protein-coupled receptor n=1 Tax=Pristionchus pacificus TaxID=54126 RepID=A0A8R1UUB4_PRIPA|nr:hypothetical protein PRIPAC_77795 [Pristionchus pacificus]|eukprot:PDM78409.1 G protein-coupled receptor [Pristionchus pacificus]